MTEDELTSGISSPRSRELMRVFKDTEFVEQLGSGMNRMMSVYKHDIFHISPNFFHVVFYYYRDFIVPNNSGNGTINDTLKLTTSEISVFEEIKKNPSITTEEIVSFTRLSMRTVARAIKSLREKQIISREGSKKTGMWVVKNNA